MLYSLSYKQVNQILPPLLSFYLSSFPSSSSSLMKKLLLGENALTINTIYISQLLPRMCQDCSTAENTNCLLYALYRTFKYDGDFSTCIRLVLQTLQHSIHHDNLTVNLHSLLLCCLFYIVEEKPLSSVQLYFVDSLLLLLIERFLQDKTQTLSKPLLQTLLLFVSIGNHSQVQQSLMDLLVQTELSSECDGECEGECEFFCNEEKILYGYCFRSDNACNIIISNYFFYLYLFSSDIDTVSFCIKSLFESEPTLSSSIDPYSIQFSIFLYFYNLFILLLMIDYLFSITYRKIMC